MRFRSWFYGMEPKGPPPFDPTTLGDPVAIETSWGPANAGGSGYRTHRLVHRSPKRLEFVATTGSKRFWGSAGVLGVVIAVFMLVGPSPARDLRLVLLLTGVVLVIGSVRGLSQLLTLHVFDLRRSEYRDGPGEPSYSLREDEDTPVSLDSIYAVQVIPEWVRGRWDSNSYSYELNLVLADATRIAVIDHWNLKRVREDARELAEFLGKPFWDATEAMESDDGWAS